MMSTDQTYTFFDGNERWVCDACRHEKIQSSAQIPLAPSTANHVGFAMIQDTQVALVADSTLPKDSAWLSQDQVLRFGVGSDLELIFFHMNMTPADKEFLAGVKITLDSPVVYG